MPASNIMKTYLTLIRNIETDESHYLTFRAKNEPKDVADWLEVFYQYDSIMRDQPEDGPGICGTNLVVAKCFLVEPETREELYEVINKFIDEHRAKSLWFMSPDWYPVDDKDRNYALDRIKTRYDGFVYTSASILKQSLLVDYEKTKTQSIDWASTIDNLSSKKE